MVTNRSISRQAISRKVAAIVGVIISVALTSALALRIQIVNQSQLVIPERHFSMGDEVDLDGSFIYDNQENTAGYSIRVDKAEVMSASEYMKRYAKDGNTGSTASKAEGDVLVLTYTITNADNETGFLDMVMLMAVGESRNHLYKVDDALWERAEPSLENSNALVLKPNSTYTTELPFSYYEGPGLFESTTAQDNERRAKIEDAGFSLYVSNAPQRNIVDIRL